MIYTICVINCIKPDYLNHVTLFYNYTLGKQHIKSYSTLCVSHAVHKVHNKHMTYSFRNFIAENYTRKLVRVLQSVSKEFKRFKGRIASHVYS